MFIAIKLASHYHPKAEMGYLLDHICGPVCLWMPHLFILTKVMFTIKCSVSIYFSVVATETET